MLLQFWRCRKIPTVADIRMRYLPKIPVDTPMFDVLNLFQASGNAMSQTCHCIASHSMALDA